MPPLSPRLSGLGKSKTLAINEHSAALIRAGRDVVRCGLGQSPFPVPERVVDSLREHAAEKDYLPVEGLYALRAGYADFARRTEGLDLAPEQVLVAPGSKELLFLIQLAFDGDLVVPAPSWVSYRPQAQLTGSGCVSLATTAAQRWRLQPDVLDAACADGAPRLLILNYPGNPDGLTYSPDELGALAEVCRRRNVTVLSDEIYGLLHHEGRHHSIAHVCPERTVVTTGLSKWCGAGGWRLGVATFPPELSWLQDAVASAASETYTSVAAPIQYAAVTAYEDHPELTRYLDRSRAILRELGQRLVTILDANVIDVPAPEGAFYLLLDFHRHAASLRDRGIRDAETLCARLLDDTGVAVLPGSAFGLPPERLTARLAYVDFDGAAALRFEDADAAVDQTGARLLDGVTRLAAWITGPT